MEQKQRRRRLIFLGMVFFLCGCYLAYRLYRIQGAGNISWATQAVQQRSDRLALYRQRGAILDCRGNRLTGRDHRTYLAVFPPLLTAEERKEITPLLEAHHLRINGQAPLTIANPSTELVRFANGQKGMGVTFCTIPLRYGQEPIAHHLLGYLHPTTGQGLAGLEAIYEQDLNSGRMVNLTVMTDALRRPIPGLGWRYQEEQSIPTEKNLVLTLDRDLQRKVEALLDQFQIAKGAVVLMEVGSGKIRALASRPVFDPYRPQQSLNQPERPLLNRALQAYPPGGIFKLIITAAALESGKFSPETLFYPAQSGHGLVSLTQAFAYAIPAVFQEMVAVLDQTSLLALAKACGLGAAGRLGLPEEGTGLLPGLDEKDKVSLASGEKGIAVTPVQMAALIQVVAGNGWYYPPSVVEGLQEPDGSWSQRFSGSPVPNQPVLSGPTVRALQKMLEATVLYGTGQKAQIRQGAAGTGGAVQSGQAGKGPLFHSWFAGYAPAHAPRLVGVVFLEDDPEGVEKTAEKAAALFAAIMEGV